MIAVAVSVTLLLVATVIYTFGDLWHGTAGAGLAYDLAPPDAIGAYQGVDGMVALANRRPARPVAGERPAGTV
ncbi:hypothetical protein [Micromonospora sp. NPDC004551]|uniref:hypothetical protein n=1 Tax=Micromonospora sp. NPDC004551 TaxID=3154284 RepID=UPI0033A99987